MKDSLLGLRAFIELQIWLLAAAAGVRPQGLDLRAIIVLIVIIVIIVIIVLSSFVNIHVPLLTVFRIVVIPKLR